MRWIVMVMAAGLLCGSARGQETSALINKELDKPQKLLELNDMLPAVLEKIDKQTGVPIRVEAAVWELLPWGRDTAVNAKIQNLTLREALDAITRKLGLVWAVRDEFVEISPMPGLRRLAQRAGPDEIKALDLLASRPLKLDTDHPTISRLLEAVDLKLADEKDVQVAIENRIGDVAKPDRTVSVPRNATLMEALESLTKETRVTWYPWGKSIVVTAKEQRTRRMLAKPLTIRGGENGIELAQVYLDIAARTGVLIEFQSGAIAGVPAEAKVIKGIIDNAPAIQILEALSGTTGLKYLIMDDKVIISSPTSGGGGAAQEPPAGFVQLDIGFSVLVPANQLSPEMREWIKYKTEKELVRLKKMMEEEGFKGIKKPE